MKTHLVATALVWIGSALFSFGQAQDINLTGYTLAFDDEFNSLSVSSSNPKGAANWYAGPPNGSPGDFSSSNWNINAFSVSGGILSDEAWYSNPAINGQNWQSGLIASVDPSVTGFSQLFGYFEIRCQMPNAGEGAWPAFWLDSTNGISGGQNEEIDIFEWYGVCDTPGSDYDYVQEASHNWNSNGTQNQSLPYLYSPETNMPDGEYPWQGYHIYGCQVDPVHITWYIDGVQTNQIATPTSYLTSPFYVMVDYALGGGWSLSGTPFTTDGSSSLLVDWVRVYSLPSSSPAITSSTSASGTVGAAFNYQITATNSPTSYSATGLPGGLSVNTSTGAITGTPTASGTSSVTIGATNSSGTGTAALTLTVSASGGTTTYYQDSFNRSGDLQGSAPGVHDTDSNTWTVSSGTGSYTTNGSVVYDKKAAYDAAWLPVNGSSGVTLDGTKNFTLSATITPDTSGYWLGISLNTAAPGSGGNIFSYGLVSLVVGNGYSGAFSGSSDLTYNYTTPGAGTGAATSLTYSASAGTMTFTVGTTTVYTLTGVTASQIASVRAISLGNSACTTSATIGNYTLTVGSSGGGSAPVITSGTSASGTVGTAFSYQITASNSPTSYSATGLPGGLSVNTSTGAITGTPTASGTSSVTIGATNASGTGTATLTLTISAASSPPVITSNTSASGTVGTAFSYQITATNSPTSYSATGLPGGLSVNTGTGAITGTPTASGTSSVTIGATNASGTGTATLTLTISPETYYQDSFNRTGDLQGSKPGVHDTNSNTWTVSSGTGAYTTNGSAVYDKNATYDAAWLPVNGSSGVTLDGTKNFTLSATITPDTSGYWLGISLNTSAPGSGGNIFSYGLVSVVVGNGYSGAFSGSTALTYNYTTPPAGTGVATSLTYSSSAGTMTYTVGGTTIYTLTGVTASQIASIRAISLGNSACTTSATIGSYTLTVGQ